MMNNLSSPPQIGIAIAGLGFGESVHLPAIRSNPIFKPIGIWHPRKERLLEASKKNEIDPYEDWSQLLENKDVSGVIIATPPEPRFKLAIEALNANKHILLEKPAALNIFEINEIQRLALQKRLTVAVNFEYRAVPLFMEAQKLIEKRIIGDPWLIRLDWLMSSRADSSRPWNWYSDKEKGGGVIGALGTHAFDILHWLCGTTKTVTGLTNTSLRERLDPKSNKTRKVTSEDVALAELEIENPSNGETIPTQVSLSSVSREGRGFLLEIYGSDGTLSLSSNNQKDYVHGFVLSLAKSPGKLAPITNSEEFSFPSTWSDGRIAPVARLQHWWSKSIRNKTPMIPGLSEAYLSQKVCDELKESSISGLRKTIA